jgi:hypothetical protein
MMIDNHLHGTPSVFRNGFICSCGMFRARSMSLVCPEGAVWCISTHPRTRSANVVPSRVSSSCIRTVSQTSRVAH